MATRDDVLVWMDLEMTGLDPRSCAIVQLGMVLTDRQLNELAAPFEVDIWQPESVLEAMSPFVRDMHERSGLLAKVRASKTSLAEAERQALELIARHATFGSACLCGNSVWQDRRFLIAHMPSLENFLHYRQIDVSTLKQLADWWYQKKYVKPEHGQHTALFDIQQSISELRFLKAAVMK